tara:strand:+ start:166 stop:1065 length:900 start_codon:yes stop_codon:yes gene_type:complete
MVVSVAPSMQARCVLEARAHLAEGPHWWAERSKLLWVDIEASRIGLFDPCSGQNSFVDVGCHVGCVVPTASQDLLAATADGFLRVNPINGARTLLHHPEAHCLDNRFNDGKCDPWGRLWAGSMHYEFVPGAAALWRLDTNLESRRMRSAVTISNGLAWSSDRRFLYFIDSPTLQVLRLPLDEQGDPTDQGTVCVEIPASWNCVPDGMTIDAEGMLWIALHDGSAVTRWDPTSGEHLATVELPCSKVTSCCFGGENLDQLFITTARHQLDPDQLEKQPLAGGLFVAEVGVAGLLAQTFDG